MSRTGGGNAATGADEGRDANPGGGGGAGRGRGSGAGRSVAGRIGKSGAGAGRAGGDKSTTGAGRAGKDGAGTGSAGSSGSSGSSGLSARPVRRPGSRPGFTVLEGFAGRRSTLPFALLVMTVLGAGLVSVLILNTAIDHGAFQLQQSQQRQTDLTNQEQQLQQQVAGLSAPGPLASQAAKLGMVPNQQPAFLDPSAGTVLGTPAVATSPPPPPTTPPPTTPPPATTAPPAPAPVGTAGVTAAAVPSAGADTAPGATGVPAPGASVPAAPAQTAAAAPAPPPAATPAANPDPAGSSR